MGKTEIVVSIEEAGQRVVLRRRGDAFDVLLGNVVLLSSGALETEYAFGRLAATLVDTPLRSVAVGGLGFAATLRGLLDVAAPDARVLVVEKLAAVETLLRTHLSRLEGGALSDPRVEIVRGDVADVIARERELDAILLDVDNGPDWASFRSNARLYASAGLKGAYDSLRPGGVLSVWSGYAAEAFVGQLRRAGFEPRTIPLKEGAVVRARAYVGTRPRLLRG